MSSTIFSVAISVYLLIGLLIANFCKDQVPSQYLPMIIMLWPKTLSFEFEKELKDESVIKNLLKKGFKIKVTK